MLNSDKNKTRRSSAGPRVRRVGCVALLIALVAPVGAAQSDKLPPNVYAQVGSQQISTEQWHEFLAQRLRQKYFHGRLVHEQMAQAQQDIAQELIDRYLLVQEAARRGLVVSTAESSADDDIGALRNDARQRVSISDADVRAFYENNPDKFTMPEQVRLSVILVAVPPYAPAEQWQQAQAQVAQLVSRVREGDLLADLAKQFSGHESAARGGDLGLIHKGRLAPEVEAVVDQLDVGAVSEPVMLLQGVALFRLEEKLISKLNRFEDVQDRARALLREERLEIVWRDMLAQLRKATPVIIADGGP